MNVEWWLYLGMLFNGSILFFGAIGAVLDFVIDRKEKRK